MLISFVEDSSSSGFLTIFLKFFYPLTSDSGVPILSVLIPRPLSMVWINLSLLALYILFYISIRLWSLLYSFMYNNSSIPPPSSRYIAPSVDLLFFLIKCSLFYVGNFGSDIIFQERTTILCLLYLQRLVTLLCFTLFYLSLCFILIINIFKA